MSIFLSNLLSCIPYNDFVVATWSKLILSNVSYFCIEGFVTPLLLNVLSNKVCMEGYAYAAR